MRGIFPSLVQFRTVFSSTSRKRATCFEFRNSSGKKCPRGHARCNSWFSYGVPTFWQEFPWNFATTSEVVIQKVAKTELNVGFEPTTCGLRVHCGGFVLHEHGNDLFKQFLLPARLVRLTICSYLPSEIFECEFAIFKSLPFSAVKGRIALPAHG